MAEIRIQFLKDCKCNTDADRENLRVRHYRRAVNGSQTDVTTSK